MNQHVSVTFIKNVDEALSVMRSAAEWLRESGMNPSEYWMVENMNRDYMLQHADPDDFYVGLVGDTPAVACLLQDNERNQSWKYIDGDAPKQALYIHWLCVDRKFAGYGLPVELVKYAIGIAKKKNLLFVRLDTEANTPKLRKVYEDIGFMLMGVDKNTAFYQMVVIGR